MPTLFERDGAATSRDLATHRSEPEHYLTCPRCRQRIDTRRLAEVLHHAEPGHQPIEAERRPTPLKFIPPLLPTISAEVPSGGRWMHEIKFDGYRTQLHVEQSRVRAYTRNGHDWTARYRPIADCAADLACVSAIIDGELIIQDEQGRCDFHRLKAAIHDTPERLVFMAFDLLHLDGRDLRTTVLERRRGLLERLLGPNDPSRSIHLSEAVADGRALFDAVDAMGLEGIVSKKLGSRYRSGPSKDWLKTKCFAEEDLIVVGTERGDKAPVALLARERDGRLEYAGGAMITLREPERELFWRTAETLKVHAPALPMKAGKDVSWTRPEMRVRVRTLKGERMLRHATVRAIAPA